MGHVPGKKQCLNEFFDARGFRHDMPLRISRDFAPHNSRPQPSITRSRRPQPRLHALVAPVVARRRARRLSSCSVSLVVLVCRSSGSSLPLPCLPSPRTIVLASSRRLVVLVISRARRPSRFVVRRASLSVALRRRASSVALVRHAPPLVIAPPALAAHDRPRPARSSSRCRHDRPCPRPPALAAHDRPCPRPACPRRAPLPSQRRRRRDQPRARRPSPVCRASWSVALVCSSSRQLSSRSSLPSPRLPSPRSTSCRRPRSTRGVPQLVILILCSTDGTPVTSDRLVRRCRPPDVKVREWP